MRQSLRKCLLTNVALLVTNSSVIMTCKRTVRRRDYDSNPRQVVTESTTQALWLNGSWHSDQISSECSLLRHHHSADSTPRNNDKYEHSVSYRQRNHFHDEHVTFSQMLDDFMLLEVGRPVQGPEQDFPTGLEQKKGTDEEQQSHFDWKQTADACHCQNDESHPAQPVMHGCVRLFTWCSKSPMIKISLENNQQSFLYIIKLNLEKLVLVFLAVRNRNALALRSPSINLLLLRLQTCNTTHCGSKRWSAWFLLVTLLLTMFPKH